MEHLIGVVIALSAVSVTLIWVLLALAAPLLWLWMLIDAALRPEYEYPNATATSNDRLMWTLLIAFIQIAAIPYFFAVYSKVRRGTVPQAVQEAIQPLAA